MQRLQHQLRTQGFCIVRQLLAPSTAQIYRSEIAAQLAAQNADKRRSGVAVWLPDLMPKRVLQDLLSGSPATFATTVCGPQAELLSAKPVIKDADRAHPTPFHADRAYWGGIPKYSLWLALDDVTRDNGCLRVVPGSHLFDPPLEHEPVQPKGAGGNGDNSQTEKGQDSQHTRAQKDGSSATATSSTTAATASNFKADDNNAKSVGFEHRISEAAALARGVAPVDVVLGVGDAVWFVDGLVHGSHRNSSGRPRWAFIATYRDGSQADSATLWDRGLRVAQGGSDGEWPLAEHGQNDVVWTGK